MRYENIWPAYISSFANSIADFAINAGWTVREAFLGDFAKHDKRPARRKLLRLLKTIE